MSSEGRLPDGEHPLDASLREETTLDLFDGLTHYVAELRMANARGDLRHVEPWTYLSITLSHVRVLADRLGEEEQTIPDTFYGLAFASRTGQKAVGIIVDGDSRGGNSYSGGDGRVVHLFPDRADLPDGGPMTGAPQYDRQVAGKEVVATFERALAELVSQFTTRELIDGLADAVARLQRWSARGGFVNHMGLERALMRVSLIGDRLGAEEQTIPDTVNGLYYLSNLRHAWIATLPDRGRPRWQRSLRPHRQVFPDRGDLPVGGSTTGASQYDTHVARKGILATLDRALAELGSSDRCPTDLFRPK